MKIIITIWLAVFLSFTATAQTTIPENIKNETKALMRMNNLVNLHGINEADMVAAVQSCSDFQDMGYSVLETCIRQALVDITGKPLP